MNFLSLAVSTTTGMDLSAAAAASLVQKVFIEILPFQIRVGREGLWPAGR